LLRITVGYGSVLSPPQTVFGMKEKKITVEECISRRITECWMGISLR